MKIKQYYYRHKTYLIIARGYDQFQRHHNINALCIIISGVARGWQSVALATPI